MKLVALLMISSAFLVGLRPIEDKPFKLEVTEEWKNAACDALEFAMANSEHYDNDVTQCRHGYTRERCISGEFRQRSPESSDESIKDFLGRLMISPAKITCDCSVLLLKKGDKITGDITGCL